MLHSVIVLNDHDEIDAFNTDLETPAATADGEERRSAPAISGTAGSNAFAAFSAEDESAFDHVGDNSDALCVVENFFGDAFVRSGHNFVQYGSGMLKAIGSCFFGVSPSEG
jgi:hypothetical protein